MKAKLILKIHNIHDDNEDYQDGDYLSLNLYINEDRSFPLWQQLADNSEDEKYMDAIDNAINEYKLIVNSIPGLKLIVDQSICEFIEGSEELFRKYISRLMVEI